MKEYTKEQIEQAYKKVMQLIQIVSELEETFEGRHFTLDGHLVGSIGEIMAAYYYGIELYGASSPIHDGITKEGREVQIKITQQDRIVINEEPKYLIVLSLNRNTGKISEIYNGPGKTPWKQAYAYKKHNTKYMTLSKLLKADSQVRAEDRIPMINEIEKYNIAAIEKMPFGKVKKQSRVGKTLVEGYVNRNNQKNCGCTGKEGNYKGQMYYEMICLECGFEYKSNGCDVWLRKCPRCMG